MANETNTGIQPALLFMPDISGFTQFVNSTEIEHAQSIIQELLEIIIESNQIGLQVGEIEGDAVFFYRIGDAPSMTELLQQVQTMFSRFHQHLQLYDKQHICTCKACTSAVQLKLKILAHFGEVGGMAIKDQRKLFGKDVILIHRLLKNNLNKKEYALLTKPLFEEAQADGKLPEWFYPEEATEQYDVGEVQFKVTDLTPLREQLPPPEVPQYNSFEKAKVVLTEEAIVQAPMGRALMAVFDLSQRPKWRAGVKGIEMVTKDLINRVGTMHRCIVNPKNNPVVVTEYARIGEGSAELVEMQKNGPGGCRFKTEALGENETKVTVDLLVKNNPFVLAIFNLFMKSKVKKAFVQSLLNLEKYLHQGSVKVEPVTEAISNN